MGRPNAVIAAFVLALGVPGVAFARPARHALVAEVHVTVTDTRLFISPAGLQPGLTSFVVVNKGKNLHILTIKGPGLKGVRTQKVSPGASATLAVKLVLGAYKLSAPVGLGKTSVRWLVVRPSTVVGPPKTAKPAKTPSTTTVVPGGMGDYCDL